MSGRANAFISPAAADGVAAVLTPELGGSSQSDGAPSHTCLLNPGNSSFEGEVSLIGSGP